VDEASRLVHENAVDQETLMSDSVPLPQKPLPRWLVVTASLVVAWHVGAVLLLVLASPSGPWPTPYGSSTAVGPVFALRAGDTVTRHYLTPLKMTHNYHFLRNRPGMPSVWFEVRLRDAEGNLIRTVRFPDPDAAFPVRHRQSVLAHNLADDQPVQARPGEVIPAPNQSARTVEMLDRVGDGVLALRSVPEHLVPRDRPVFRPSDWSMILARSTMRHLLRMYRSATSAELVRHTREAIMPALLFSDDLPADTFRELVTHFGEVKK
jgi:hypothetical protein